MNTILIFSLFMLLTGNDENPYHKAKVYADYILSVSHEDIDSAMFCEGKMKSIMLSDSVINKPGSIGTEYNYPIYKFETEITYYKNGNIAAVEVNQIQLKRYESYGVTTGIKKTATLDSLNTFYFDEDQHLITHAQLLEIKRKLCRDN